MLVLACISLGIFFLWSGLELTKTHGERVRSLGSQKSFLLQKELSKDFLFVKLKWIHKSSKWFLIVGGLLSIVLVSITPFVISLFSLWIVPILLTKLIHRRRQKQFHQQLTQILPLLSSSLKAGASLEKALEQIVTAASPPISQEIGLVLKELRIGKKLENALEHLESRFPSYDLILILKAISISRKLGSNLSSVFDRLSETIATRRKFKDRLESLTVQGKTQAIIAATIPIAVIAVLHIISPGYFDPLFQTNAGKTLVLFLLIAMITGIFWVHKICTIETFS